jgi:hypothetical protein
MSLTLLSINKSLPKWRVCTDVAVPRLHCSSLFARCDRVCVVVLPRLYRYSSMYLVLCCIVV